MSADRDEAPREPFWQRRDLQITLVLFFLALLPRLYVALAWPREPVWDGHYYDFGARRIAEGHGYSDDSVVGGVTVWHPWCHYPVGYSGFLAFFYWIFGAGPHVGTVANAFVGALTAVVVYRLARYVTTETRARIAGVLTAANPGLIAYTALLMTEPLAAFGILLAAWLYVRDRDRPLRAGAVAGFILGLATLVRPPSILLAPALFFFTERGREIGIRGVLKRLSGPAAATALSLLTVLPWTARNCRVMDGCAFVSTNAGWNLMIGAFPRATGRFETVRATDGCPVVTGQVQQDRCWADAGIAHIRSEPGRWLGLAPKKLGYTFDHESFPTGYLGEANPQVWTEERKALGREILGGAHRLLLLFAALAAVGLPSISARGDARKRLFQWLPLLAVVGLGLYGFLSDYHPFWPLAAAVIVVPCLPLPGAPPRWGGIAHLVALVASVAAVAIVFFGEDRYHMVATPALCLLCSCALRKPSQPLGIQPGNAVAQRTSIPQ
ncbi:MAG: glycosyltransferase family 39 protein [Polyangiaceae bacterium]